ncbi:MAG TPA: glycosyltransferase family 39 protein [Burkholderiaceae bacterium]|nr:glycosyltransferase family 39 protein [Burkholderiaceae bacterium]
MRWPTLTLAALCALACTVAILVGTGHPLQNVNEGEYARIAQEMVHRGAWSVPTLNGLPYFEKPPLLYWIDALAFRVVGFGPRAARVAPMVGACLALASITWIALRHAPPRAALYGPWVLLSAPIVLVLDRVLLFDLLLTGLLACAFAAFLEAWHQDRSRPWMRASLVFLALAMLAKGLLPVVLYVLVVALFAAWERASLIRLRSLVDPVAIALFLALVVPWHIAAQWQEPGFARFYFVNEHLMRFLDRRVPHDYHTGPPWHYVPRLLVGMFPWVLLLTRPRRIEAEAPGHVPTVRLLTAWFVVTFCFFTLSKAKGDYYLVGAAPPIALLCAIRLAEAPLPAWRLALLPAAWVTLLGGVFAWAVTHPSASAMPARTPVMLVAAAVLSMVSVIAAFRGMRAAAVAACAAVALPVATVFSNTISTNEAIRSSATLAQRVVALKPRDVYLYREFETLSALPAYLDRCVGVVDSRSSDLRFGLSLHPDPLRFPDAGTLAATIGSRRVVVIVPEREAGTLEGSALGDRLHRLEAIGGARLYVSKAIVSDLPSKGPSVTDCPALPSSGH